MSVLQRAGGSPGFPVVSEPSPASDWSTVSQFPSTVRMAVEGEIQPQTHWETSRRSRHVTRKEPCMISILSMNVL